MSDNKELLEKVKKDIIKSGYPLELYCGNVLIKDKWMISSGSEYKSELGKYRSIDIEVHKQKQWGNKRKRYVLFYVLNIECKKNEKKPWVFFEGKIPNIINCMSGKKDYHEIFRSKFYNLKSHHYTKFENKSRNYTVAFQNKDTKESRQIYSAITNLSENYESFIKTRRKVWDERESIKDITITNLCIVFDGILLFAKINNKEIDLKEIDLTSLYYSKSNVDGNFSCNIDIVKKEYFVKYIEMLNKSKNFLEKYLKRWSEKI